MQSGPGAPKKELSSTDPNTVINAYYNSGIPGYQCTVSQYKNVVMDLTTIDSNNNPVVTTHIFETKKIEGKTTNIKEGSEISFNLKLPNGKFVNVPISMSNIASVGTVRITIMDTVKIRGFKTKFTLGRNMLMFTERGNRIDTAQAFNSYRNRGIIYAFIYFEPTQTTLNEIDRRINEGIGNNDMGEIIPADPLNKENVTKQDVAETLVDNIEVNNNNLQNATPDEFEEEQENKDNITLTDINVPNIVPPTLMEEIENKLNQIFIEAYQSTLNDMHSMSNMNNINNAKNVPSVKFGEEIDVGLSPYLELNALEYERFINRIANERFQQIVQEEMLREAEMIVNREIEAENLEIALRDMGNIAREVEIQQAQMQLQLQRQRVQNLRDQAEIERIIANRGIDGGIQGVNRVAQLIQAYNYARRNYAYALVGSFVSILSAYGVYLLFAYDGSYAQKTVDFIYSYANSSPSNRVTMSGNKPVIVEDLENMFEYYKKVVPESSYMLPESNNGVTPLPIRSNASLQGASTLPTLSVSISSIYENTAATNQPLVAQTIMKSMQSSNPRLPDAVGPTQLDHLLGPTTVESVDYVSNTIVPPMFNGSPALRSPEPTQLVSYSPTMRIAPTQPPFNTVVVNNNQQSTIIQAPWKVNYNIGGYKPLSTSLSLSPTPTPTPTPGNDSETALETPSPSPSPTNIASNGTSPKPSSRFITYIQGGITFANVLATESAKAGVNYIKEKAVDGLKYAGNSALSALGFVTKTAIKGVFKGAELIVLGVAALLGYYFFRR